jgi:hypothetical protein
MSCRLSDRIARLLNLFESTQAVDASEYHQRSLKAYTKGERVLRFEAIVQCGRRLDRFPKIITRFREMLRRFLNNLYFIDAYFISDVTLDRLPNPSQVGNTRVGCVNIN